jgi:light-regulated signal transduction histidine kinase (bacteriophytochrome)
MDVRMPGLNGFETANLIYERDKLKHIPIIFITANDYGDQHAFEGYQTGAVDYIYKPINADVLRSKVSVFVDLYEKNAKLLEQERILISTNAALEREIKTRIASEKRVQKLNRQLVKNIQNLEAMNAELDRFAFMASHDLQEPLRKIRLYASKFVLRNNDKIVGEDLQDIEKIQQSAERMQSLIRDILAMAKISGDLSGFASTDINGLIDEILIELAEEIAHKNAKVTVEKIPPLVVHPRLIKVLFHNLIGNALKYIRPETLPVVNVSYQPIKNAKNPASDAGCRIQVTDNGLGFDQEYAEQIFGMFTRLQINGNTEGTGLGLALCKKIAECHSGSIVAQGTLNKGATFILSLPTHIIPKKD